MSAWIPRWRGRTSMRPAPGKGGSAGRAARRRSRAEPADHALGRSRGGLSTKMHLASEQGQKPLSIVITAGQRGRQPAVPGRAGRYPGTPARPGQAPAPARTGCSVTRPTAPAPTAPTCAGGGSACTIPEKADQIRHRKNKGRRRWPPARLRPRDLQAAPRRRMRHQPAQAQPGRRHPLRQARRPLRSHRPHRRHQRVAPPPLMKHALAPGVRLVPPGPGDTSPPGRRRTRRRARRTRRRPRSPRR